MPDQNNTGVPSAFSSEYVRELSPFRTRAPRVPLLNQHKYNTQDSIATPDEGKRARLLKANI